MTSKQNSVKTKIIAVVVIKTGIATQRQGLYAEFYFQIIALDIAIHVPKK